MDIVRTFGSIVSAQAAKNPARARALLLAGWRAQLLNLTVHPDKRLPPSRQYAARIAMAKILEALRHPERAAATSLFTPYEPLQAAGVLPYSVEQLSSFLAGTRAERFFLDAAGDAGFTETMCSYHRGFCGAMTCDIMPKPAFVVYTTLACDANMITFPALQRHFNIPGFCIDVPFDQDEPAIANVAEQLRAMVVFIGECMGEPVREAALREAVERGWRSALAYRRFLAASPGRYLPSDMANEMYAFLLNHVLMGSPETERYNRMMANDMERASQSEGLRLVWIHTMPFTQQPAIQRLNFNKRAFITTCDMAADPMLVDVDPAKPYDAMARRLVHSCFNGLTQTRINRALDLAQRTQAHGVVLYNHWGCKGTLGASGLIKAAVEAAGLPCLVLDGDGMDSANRSDGQTSTRLDAFLEMLEGRRGAGIEPLAESRRA